MIVLAGPDPGDMVHAIGKAITILPAIDPYIMHLRKKHLYSWHDVDKRTEIVYDRALRCPQQSLLERLPSCHQLAQDIEVVPDVPYHQHLETPFDLKEQEMKRS